MGRTYLIGVAVVVVLLFYEHLTVRRAERGELDLTTIDRAFFRTNVAVSVVLFASVLLDRLVPMTGG